MTITSPPGTAAKRKPRSEKVKIATAGHAPAVLQMELSTFRAIDLVGFIHESRKSGLLVLTINSFEKKLFFQEGYF